MAIQNVEINVKTAQGYDQLYPKTTVANVTGAATYTKYTTTIPTTGWTGSTEPYTIDIPVTGITVDDVPDIGVVADSTYTTAQAQREAWGLITKITTGTNVVTVEASEIPTVAIPIQLTVTRSVS